MKIKFLLPILALVLMSFTGPNAGSPAQFDMMSKSGTAGDISGNDSFTEFKVIKSTICLDAFKEIIHAYHTKDGDDDDKNPDDTTIDKNDQGYKINLLINKYSS